MEQSARVAKRDPRQAAAQSAQEIGHGGAAVLIGAGLLAAAGAVLLGVAGEIHPSGGWIARRLAGAGVNSGFLALCATIAVGGAFLLTGLRRLGQRMTVTTLRGEELVERVGSQVVALRRSLHDFRAEVVWLREAMTGLSEVVRDHVAQAEAVRQAGSQKDEAVFRVAASLDQLGARVDHRIQKAESGQAESLARLEGHLRELGNGFEASLRSLMAELDAPASSEDRYVFSPTEADERTALEHRADYGAAFEEPYVHGDDDVEVEVTLEEHDPHAGAGARGRSPSEGHELQPAADAMDPALLETSLGLLDAFDEYGDYRPQPAEPEPKAPLPAAAEQARPQPPPGPTASAAPPNPPAPAASAPSSAAPDPRARKPASGPSDAPPLRLAPRRRPLS